MERNELDNMIFTFFLEIINFQKRGFIFMEIERNNIVDEELINENFTHVMKDV